MLFCARPREFEEYRQREAALVVAEEKGLRRNSTSAALMKTGQFMKVVSVS
jgi:hypothetical protein